jgi:hypothetical protein
VRVRDGTPSHQLGAGYLGAQSRNAWMAGTGMMLRVSASGIDDMLTQADR